MMVHAGPCHALVVHNHCWIAGIMLHGKSTWSHESNFMEDGILLTFYYYYYPQVYSGIEFQLSIYLIQRTKKKVF